MASRNTDPERKCSECRTETVAIGGGWMCEECEYTVSAHRAGDCVQGCFACYGKQVLPGSADPDREEWRVGGAERDNWTGEVLEDVDGYALD